MFRLYGAFIICMSYMTLWIISVFLCFFFSLKAYLISQELLVRCLFVLYSFLHVLAAL